MTEQEILIEKLKEVDALLQRYYKGIVKDKKKFLVEYNSKIDELKLTESNLNEKIKDEKDFHLYTAPDKFLSDFF